MPYKSKKTFEDFENNATPSSSLFHYTSQEGLTGILKTQELRLTHRPHLSGDPNELQYAIDTVKNEILRLTPEAKHSFWKELFLIIPQLVDQLFLIGITSFCTQKDYIPAWKRYANKGTGFSIEFKKEFFIPDIRAHNGQTNSVFGRTQVYYDISDPILSPIIEKAISVANENLNEQELFATITTTLISILISLKDPKYKKELEHRIYSLLDHQKNQMNSKNYFPCKFKLDQISSICIGPKLSFEEGRKILDTTGINFQENGIAIHHSTKKLKK